MSHGLDENTCVFLMLYLCWCSDCFAPRGVVRHSSGGCRTGFRAGEGCVVFGVVASLGSTCRRRFPLGESGSGWVVGRGGGRAAQFDCFLYIVCLVVSRNDVSMVKIKDTLCDISAILQSQKCSDLRFRKPLRPIVYYSRSLA